MELIFDSSFRMEKNQDFEIHAIFDGQAPIILMHATSDDSNDSIAKATFHNGKNSAFATSEEKVEFPMSLSVPNPIGAKSMVISWAMLNADNDWWWAIDNVVIKGAKVKTTAAVKVTDKLATTWYAIKAIK